MSKRGGAALLQKCFPQSRKAAKNKQTHWRRRRHSDVSMALRAEEGSFFFAPLRLCGKQNRIAAAPAIGHGHEHLGALGVL